MVKGIGEAVIIDGIGDEIGGRFYGKVGIAHCDAGTGEADHGDVVFAISESGAFGDGNIEMAGEHFDAIGLFRIGARDIGKERMPAKCLATGKPFRDLAVVVFRCQKVSGLDPLPFGNLRPRRCVVRKVEIQQVAEEREFCVNGRDGDAGAIGEEPSDVGWRIGGEAGDGFLREEFFEDGVEVRVVDSGAIGGNPRIDGDALKRAEESGDAAGGDDDSNTVCVSRLEGVESGSRNLVCFERNDGTVNIQEKGANHGGEEKQSEEAKSALSHGDQGFGFFAGTGVKTQEEIAGSDGFAG